MKQKMQDLLAEIERQLLQQPPEDLRDAVMDITQDLRGLVARLEAAVSATAGETAKTNAVSQATPAADEDPLEGYFDNMPV